jgi:hypothetical protein
MRIQVERDGGFAYFPGLSGPTTVDTDALPPGEAAALEAAVARVDFGAEAALAAAPAPGSADHRTVTITVEERGGSRSVTVSEPIADDALRSLVERVQSAQRA